MSLSSHVNFYNSTNLFLSIYSRSFTSLPSLFILRVTFLFRKHELVLYFFTAENGDTKIDTVSIFYCPTGSLYAY